MTRCAIAQFQANFINVLPSVAEHLAGGFHLIIEQKLKYGSSIKLLKTIFESFETDAHFLGCLLYTSPSPRDRQKSRMPSSA